MYTKGSGGGGTGTYDSTEERVQRRWVNRVNLPRCHRHSTRTQNKTEQSRQAAQKTLGLRPVLRPFPSFHQNQGRRLRKTQLVQVAISHPNVKDRAPRAWNLDRSKDGKGRRMGRNSSGCSTHARRPESQGKTPTEIFSQTQPDPVLARSGIARYYIQYVNKEGRTKVIFSTYQIHILVRPRGERAINFNDEGGTCINFSKLLEEIVRVITGPYWPSNRGYSRRVVRISVRHEWKRRTQCPCVFHKLTLVLEVVLFIFDANFPRGSRSLHGVPNPRQSNGAIAKFYTGSQIFQENGCLRNWTFSNTYAGIVLVVGAWFKCPSYPESARLLRNLEFPFTMHYMF